MSKINITIIAVLIILCLVLGGIVGYLLNKPEVKIIEREVKYFPGKTVVGSIKELDPIEVIVPTIPQLLVYRDTIIRDSIVYIEKVDSFKILRDYLTRRKYKEVLFNIDTVGVCDISFDVYKNEASNLNYRFTPIIKATSESKTILPPRFSLMTGFGWNTQGAINGQLIFFDRNMGLGYQYQRFGGHSYHGINAFYKIGL